MTTYRQDPLDALLKTVRARLADDTEPWGQQVAVAIPGASWAYPYATITYSGGGESNWTKTPDADIVLNIKAVSDDLGEALQCKARFATLLNDEGSQDAGALDALNGGDTWDITTVTKEQAISMTERPSKTEVIYHEGARFRFHLAAK